MCVPQAYLGDVAVVKRVLRVLECMDCPSTYCVCSINLASPNDDDDENEGGGDG